ncbi:hypothetical protein [Streptomyces sp. NPDC060198]|uniref:hypothetical protein n=1 Tax=Streptomyces sp. NPDC060198 TaxID=3347070 RepID=UPI00366398F3
MPLQDSPLWWLFAIMSAAFWLVIMVRAMPTRGLKAFVATGPVALFVCVVGYCLRYGDSFATALPVYCAVVIAVPTGFLGHRNALREKLSDPAVAYGDAEGPWTLQACVSLLMFGGLAVYYVTH